MNKDTQKIIEHLQNTVEGLKELSEGCLLDYRMVGEDFYFKIIEVNGLAITAWNQMENRLSFSTLNEIKDDERIKIIGHTPQLNHLLLAIGNTENEQDIEDLYMEVLNRYDLPKDLIANLDSNEELRNYLLTLFGL